MQESAPIAMDRPSRTLANPIVLNLSIALLYIASGRVGLMMAIPPGTVTALWPPSGIALAALLLGGRALWPGVWLGSLLVNEWTFYANHSAQGPVAVIASVVIATGSTVQTLAAQSIIMRFGGLAIFARVRDAFIFCLCPVAVCVIASSIGAGGLVMLGIIPPVLFPPTWITWYLGDLVGMLVVVPLVLSLAVPENARRSSPGSLPEGVLMMALLTAISYISFGLGWRINALIVPFFMWAGFRFKPIVMASTVALALGAALWASIEGLGPFVDTRTNVNLLLLQLFMIGCVWMVLVFGASVAERHDAIEALKNLSGGLEARVAERTHQLEAAMKEMEAFSYSISHDLRAPLRAINSYTTLVARDHAGSLPPEGREYLQRAADSALRMSQLIDDLLALSRMGRSQLAKRPLDPAMLAAEAMVELRTTVPEWEVDVRIHPMPECLADPALLKQVYMNLLSNALKFTASRKTAVIEVGWEHGRGYFVRDNGIGYDPRYGHKLFRLFERLHDPSEYEGTGVGLAIVQRIIQRHGGSVSSESKGDGGATFYFTLE